MVRINDISEARKARALQYLSEVWKPHAGQVLLGQALFGGEAKFIYGECGRKFGKSECAVYLLWMYSILNPNAETYYLAPEVKLAKELVWSNQRIHTCNSYDRNFLKKMGKILGGKIEVFKQEGRIVLPNGSFMKVDGSDNIDSQLGLKPDLIVADEMRTFKDEWLTFTTPNLAAKDGILLCISTPPLTPNRAYEHALECKIKTKEGNKRYFYLCLPSETNDAVPHLKQWLKEEKERLISLGRADEWYREYMAKTILSSNASIIPQLGRNTKTKLSKKQIKEKIKKKHVYEGYICINPGESTTCGAIFMILDRSSGEVFIMDEFTEFDSRKTSATEIWPKIQAKFSKTVQDVGIKNLWLVDTEIDGIKYEQNVVTLCPPKTPWMKRDLHEMTKVLVEDASKDCNKKEHNIGLIKDLFLSGKMYLNEDCNQLIKESETFLRNPKTYAIPNDDNKLLIYGLRACLSAMGYTSDLMEIVKDKPPDEEWLDKLKNAKTFDQRMLELRVENEGIVCHEEILFMEDDLFDI